MNRRFYRLNYDGTPAVLAQSEDYALLAAERRCWRLLHTASAASATPASNGIAIANLVRLSLLTEDLAYLDQAEKALCSFSFVMHQAIRACSKLLQALDWYCNHTLVCTKAELATELAIQYFPTSVFAFEPMPNGAVGLVCHGLTCQEPATTVQQIVSQIHDSR
ncbi:MAG: hypothetical protein AAGI45_01465 [Cyanobacteria bacterium P01_H01_bin.26]